MPSIEAAVLARAEAIASALLAERNRCEGVMAAEIAAEHVRCGRDKECAILAERQRCTEKAKFWLQKEIERKACPDGWKLVPIEPTPEMIEAGRIARMNVAGGYDGPSGWEAMLDSAPQPGDKESE
ncbi:hypothetical protein [Sinorhizobium psoraleae]|uniref:Uncharacterized protein n=1 Tax=Sinorhizobium psoraleae TaxID=520838 RepID=A0ABT4KBU3_9HYPH|nr:hypothetical protein [Sinorhizobium psoraleae]MCZ4089308.1 hypothetical protein [Sinorhizobium psoraleae]MCZ4089374.1 hypothetical protein [Sinorhizobium psoraleae]